MEGFMNVFSYTEHIFALQMVVVIGVAVAVAYSFPNGAPLRRPAPLPSTPFQRLLPH